jgi:hypothetical protein
LRDSKASFATNAPVVTLKPMKSGVAFWLTGHDFLVTLAMSDIRDGAERTRMV